MFESVEIEFAIDKDGTKSISILSVAKALEYDDPWAGYARVIKRNAECFKGQVKEYFHSGSTKKFLTRKGLDLFLLFSGQPKAKDFKVWVADHLEEDRQVLARLKDPLDQVIALAHSDIHH